MTQDLWRSEKRSEHFEVPDGPPQHLVSELLDVIDTMSQYATAEQVSALKRLARAIREESNG